MALSEDDFNATAAKKYETLLEKKWTSTVRLQKKVCEIHLFKANAKFDSLISLSDTGP